MGELQLINPPVDGGAADGQLIRWNATAQKWEPVTGAVVDEAGNVQLPGSVSDMLKEMEKIFAEWDYKNFEASREPLRGR
jgi:hypothetical protein